MDTAHFPIDSFVSKVEIILGDTFRLDPVQVSLQAIGYRQRYLPGNIFYMTPFLEKVAQTLVCWCALMHVSTRGAGGRPRRELSWTDGSRKAFKWLVETSYV